MDQGTGGWQQPPQPQQPNQQQPGEQRGQQPGAGYCAPPYQHVGQPGQFYQMPPNFGPAMQPAAPAQPRRRGWIVALVAVILFFALMFFGMASCTNAFTSMMSMGFSSGTSELDYVTGDAIGVITIDGTIQYDGSTSSPEGLKEALDLAESDNRVKAVVLRVDSGGGTATAGEEMAEYVRDFSKPIVVSSASMNASAAYEISSQADYIFTAKTTAIGAIGTAMQFTDLSGLYEMLGIRYDNITSSNSKDSSYGTRALTDEERAYYQAMVDQINETFIENVAVGRGMTTEEVRALATGLTFTGMTGVENGLADEIGTLEDAAAKAAELAGVSSYQIVDLDPAYAYDVTSLLGLLSSSESDATASVDDLIAALEEGKGSDDGLAN